MHASFGFWRNKTAIKILHKEMRCLTPIEVLLKLQYFTYQMRKAGQNGE